jgi:transcriptional regulator of heat shock response
MMQTEYLDSRQEAYLARVVDTYVQTASPVGSRALTRDPGVTMSPASVRAILASLEEAGCLYRPHCSAGRVPTDHGYRYYVDRLMPRVDLDAAEAARLRDTLAWVTSSSPDLLEATVRFLAQLLQQLIVGLRIDGTGARVRYSGARHIASQPEFSSSEDLVPIFGFLEDGNALREVLPDLVDARGDRVAIQIGGENATEAMRLCALVGVRLQTRATVVVVGTTRLDYARIVEQLGAFQELVRRMREREQRMQ